MFQMIDRKKDVKTKLIEKQSFVGLFLYISGLAYLYMLLQWSLDQKTHFSENALLPGLVHEQFAYENDVYNNYHMLKNFLAQLSNGTLTPAALAYLHGQFEANGLETYVQNFTLEKGPLVDKSIVGTNIFGIARSSRGSSNEAIVVAVSYNRRNIPALALMLALAKFCNEQVYWAKDIIFVLVEREQIGILSWLNSYHERPHISLRTSRLYAHSGSIHAAIILDMDEFLTDPMSISRADLEINMLNGQLPNLDFFNLAVRLLEKHGIVPTVYGQDVFWGGHADDAIWHHAKTALLALTTQSASHPVNLHSLFGTFGIEALTLKLSYSSWDRKLPLSKMAFVLEGILRSLNNLLEKFHASYFFYVLFSPYNFISISLYMPSIGIMLAALMLKVYTSWVKFNGISEDRNEDLTALASSQQSIDYSLVCSAVIVSHCAGLAMRFLPEIQRYFGILESGKAWLSCCIAVLLTAVCFLSFCSWSEAVPSGENSSRTSEMLFGFAILELCLILGICSLFNFGLALSLCILLVPMIIPLRPSLSKLHRLFNYLLALLVNPFLLICILTLFYDSMIAARTNTNFLSIADSFKNVNIFVSKLALDHYLFSSWHYTLLTVALVPTWIIMWISISCV